MTHKMVEQVTASGSGLDSYCSTGSREGAHHAHVVSRTRDFVNVFSQPGDVTQLPGIPEEKRRE